MARTRMLLTASGALSMVLLAGCNADGDPAGPSATHAEASAQATTFGPGMSEQSPEWQQHLIDMANYLGLESPPDVAPIRLVGDEYHDIQAECLADAGFVADDDGSFSVPEDQRETYRVTRYTCEAQYPIDPKYLQPLTEDQHKKVYLYLRDEAIACLEGLGYKIAAPPSEETYLATLNTAEQYTTSGELLKIGLTNADVEKAIKVCPEVPSVDVLYDE